MFDRFVNMDLVCFWKLFAFTFAIKNSKYCVLSEAQKPLKDLKRMYQLSCFSSFLQPSSNLRKMYLATSNLKSAPMKIDKVTSQNLKIDKVTSQKFGSSPYVFVILWTA